MVKHRNTLSFLLTTLLYASLFGSYFYMIHSYVVRDLAAQNSVIQLSLTEFVPDVIPPEEEEVVTDETPVEEIEEEVPEVLPEPVIEEKIPEPVTPKVLPKPLHKKEKPPRKKPKKIDKPKKKKVKKRKRKTHSAVNRHRGVKRQGSGHASVAEKNRFLARVRQRINHNKSYPRMAKKRGMQGSVNVRFTILRNGNVGHISVRGPKMFHSSARKAIQRSFPISTKGVPVRLPKTVNLTLRYQLR